MPPNAVNVLHVSTSDSHGGAAIAAVRLHRALRESGYESRMLVQDRSLDDPTIHGDDTPWEKLLARGRHYFERALLRLQDTSNPIYHSVNVLPSGRVSDINQSDADVIHLHWVNNGMLSIAEIGRIQKPTVWTLHDAWPFCGAEHYPEVGVDHRHREGYRRNNRNENHSALDLDRWTWNRKHRHWTDVPTAVVAPSKWIAKEAKESELFSSRLISVIPNTINTNVYRPYNSRFARDVLGLPHNKLLVVFGSLKPTSDSRKGFHLLRSALQQVQNKFSNIALGIFGAGQGPGSEMFGFPTYYLGYMHDDPTLALVYSAADVVVVPSKIESFGLTAAEALACGTPVVCFRTPGLKSIVDHKKTGYLANPFDTDDFASGIEFVLDENRKKYLSLEARKTAVDCFSFNTVSRQHNEVYNKAIHRYKSNY